MGDAKESEETHLDTQTSIFPPSFDSLQFQLDLFPQTRSNHNVLPCESEAGSPSTVMRKIESIPSKRQTETRQL
jgi:hypothetical protein